MINTIKKIQLNDVVDSDQKTGVVRKSSRAMAAKS